MNNIDFSPERFARIREVYGKWWSGKGERPVAGAIIPDRKRRGTDNGCPVPSQNNIGLNKNIDDYLDSIDYHYSAFSFYGDAFPCFNLDCFGPGIAAAFLGADADNSSGGVWFFPKQAKTAETLDFEYDPDNEWLRYIRTFCRRAREKFDGKMLFSMPDLGGVMDILSTFLSGEELLFALYDYPDRVKYLTKKITALWKKYYDDIAAELGSAQCGYTDWSMIYSEKPSYVIQCDFSYMIGNDMFNEFALDDLSAQCDYLDNVIYHLDGVKELNHLDSLLSINKLKAVQWVPGTGNKPIDEWPEVYRRITRAGKRAQVLCHGYDKFEKIVGYIDSPGLALYQQTYCLAEADGENAKEALKRLKIQL